MEVYVRLFADMPRAGPGCDESTERAFKSIPDLPHGPRILDIGCGPGMQTLCLARISQGRITALDNYEEYLDYLRSEMKQQGLTDRISPVRGDMFDIPFEDRSFDIVWCESAIFIIGFEKGLREWKRLLKPGGFMVVSELVQLKSGPPKEYADFWRNEYPALTTLNENVEIIKNAGYELVDHFTLPEWAWWKNLYDYVEGRIEPLKRHFQNDPESLQVLNSTRREIDFFKKYPGFYDYEFFVMKNT